MEIVGWRLFWPDGNGLRSVSSTYRWVCGENQAWCPLCETPPGENCACGFHAWSDPALAFTTQVLVMGLVTAWGRVVEHELGFRAEFARIVALCDLKDRAAGFPAIGVHARAYGALLVDHETICDRGFVAEFGELIGRDD